MSCVGRPVGIRNEKFHALLAGRAHGRNRGTSNHWGVREILCQAGTVSISVWTGKEIVGSFS